MVKLAACLPLTVVLSGCVVIVVATAPRTVVAGDDDAGVATAVALAGGASGDRHSVTARMSPGMPLVFTD